MNIRIFDSAKLDLVDGNKKKAIEKFIDYLSDNPFDEGDFTESDESGRFVHCKIIRDYANLLS